MYKTSKRQEELLKFIEQKGDVSQPDIVEYFIETFKPKNKNSARVSVCVMLKKLEANGIIKSIQKKNKESGGIDLNIWSKV